MMKRNSISYNMNNKGSAIITALVVSTVLLVLCLSLLLVASSLFSATVSKEADFPDREYIYSVAEEVEKELLNVSCTYKDDSEMEAFFTQDSHQLWDYIRVNLWQGFIKNGDLYTQYISEEDRVSGKIWPYYDKDASSDNIHGDAQYYSRYFTLDTGVTSGNKIVVQMYWELPDGWNGDINNKKDTVLHAVYRMYGDNDEVVSKVEKVYKLDLGMIDPYANYTVNYYAIVIENGEVTNSELLGKKTLNETQTIGSIPNYSSLPSSLSGYKLGSTWYKLVDGVYTAVTDEDLENVILSDIEFYNICERNTFTVTFSYNYEGATDPFYQVVVSEGAKVTCPNTDPTREGYKFKGWYSESACNILWDFDDYTIHNDTEIYANWNEVYTVTFDLKGNLDENKFKITTYPNVFNSTYTYSLSVENGDTITMPSPSPEAEAKKVNGNNKKDTVNFTGWKTAKNGETVTWNFNDPVVSNLNLTASWVVGYYAQFVRNNDAVPVPDPLFYRSVHGKDHKLPQPKSDDDDMSAIVNDYFVLDTGNDNNPWYNEPACLTKFAFDVNHNNEVHEIYAKWKRVAYKTVFDLNGIGSWNTEDISSNFVSSIYGTWYVDQDRKLVGPSEKDKAIIAPNSEVFGNNVIGYKFDGWNYTVTKEEVVIYSGKWDFSDPLNYSDDEKKEIIVTLTANWIPEYTIEFYDFNNTETKEYLKVNETSPLNASEVNNYSLLDKSSYVSKEGFEFKGWSYTSSGETIENLDDAISNADSNHVIKLYAQWDKLYTVNFLDNKLETDDKVIKCFSQKTENAINDLITSKNFFPDDMVSTISGYDFVGWNYTAESKTNCFTANSLSAIDISQDNDGIINIYVIRDLITYYIKVNGFTPYIEYDVEDSLTYNHIKDFFKNAVESKLGYIFDQWYYSFSESGDKTIKRNSSDVVYDIIEHADSNNNIYLQANYSLQSYDINYANVQYDSTTGSYIEVQYNDVDLPSDRLSSYTVNSSVTFSLSGASRDGSNFLGWATRNGNSYNLLPINEGKYTVTLPVNNPSTITFYAIWSTKEYSVTYSTFGVDKNFEDLCSGIFAYKQKLTQPDTASLMNGVEIVGWFKNEGLTEPWNFETDIITGPVTLYAKMNIEVTFNAGDGKFPGLTGDSDNIVRIKVSYNTILSDNDLPVNPERNDYTFSGWKPNYKESAILSPKEFTAEWTEVGKYSISFANGNSSPNSNVDISFLPDSINNVRRNQYITEYQCTPKTDKGHCAWYIDLGCTKKFDFNKTLEENFGKETLDSFNTLTLYAKWDVTPWKVRFILNNEVLKEIICSNNDTITGYDMSSYYSEYGAFDKWLYNGGSWDGKETFTVNNNIDFVAKFKGFKVTFHFDEADKIRQDKFGIIPFRYHYVVENSDDYDDLYYENGQQLSVCDMVPELEVRVTEIKVFVWIEYDNRELGKIPVPQFIGFFKDPEYCIPATSLDIVTGNIDLYPRWLFDEEIEQMLQYDNRTVPPLNAQQEFEFNEWYGKNDGWLSSFYNDNNAKERAKKLWYFYIKGYGNETSSNSTFGKKAYSESNYYSASSEEEIIVHESGAPNEAEGETTTVDPNDNPEDENDIKLQYPVVETYVVENITVNPFNHAINPRELWTWKKVS
ncbi:MAG: InlB B-repeat-containing protein [Lachnospiraceae bacterium]|nr:InlB B-repeat-containing protein [Lachnospiraceae bacterium]